MTAARAAFAVALGWAALCAGERWLRRARPTLAELLERHGVQLSPGYVGWRSARVGEWLGALHSRGPGRLLRGFYAAGAWFGLVAMTVSIVLLAAALVTQFTRPADEQVLTPVLPGVNLPMDRLGYFLLGLIVSGVVHEAGHAMAAGCQDVPVLGFGVFLYVIYPGAYVDLADNELQRLPPAAQIRIFCAGVWHNFVLCVLCAVVLAGMSVLLWPLYALPNAGATVVWLDERSPMLGSLAVGSVVRRVNGCDVHNTRDWTACMLQTVQHESGSGYCLARGKVEDMFPQTVYSCCDADGDDGAVLASSVCFRSTDMSTEAARFCLPVRQIVGNRACTADADCSDEACLVPSLPPGERLVALKLQDEPVALFVGDPRALYQTSLLTDYRPRHWLLPVTGPLQAELALQYTLSMSLALAVLNMVPAYALDGQHVLQALVQLHCGHWDVARQAALTTAVLRAGSALFGTLLVVSLWNALA